MARFRLSATAQADLIGILAWTQGQFGDAARKHYETLLATAPWLQATSSRLPKKPDQALMTFFSQGTHRPLVGPLRQRCQVL